MSPAEQRVLGLQGGDRVDRDGTPHGVGRRLGQSEVAHLPLGDQLGHRPDRLLDRNVRVRAMQVVEVDVVDTQALQRALDRVAHVLGPTVDLPDTRFDGSETDDAELRRQRHLITA